MKHDVSPKRWLLGEALESDRLDSQLLPKRIALPVFALCRRLLRPVLAVDPLAALARRRPHREAGPLGLRGLEI